MQRGVYRMWMVFFIFMALFWSLSGAAQANEPTTRSSIENLRERIQALEAKQKNPFWLDAIGKHLRIGGLLELEAFYRDVEGAEQSSDLVLATAQLDFIVEINDHLSGYVILLYEEGETEPIEVDEAAFTLAHTLGAWGAEIALTGGKLYVPFGWFTSNFITDPLTLELGETNNTAALFTWTRGMLEATLGLFNGEVDTVGDKDMIDSLVAALNVTPHENLSFGASWISDLAESDIGLVTDESLYTKNVPGFSAFVNATLGAFSLTGEYLTALDSFDEPVVAAGEDLTGRRPVAWIIELAFSPEERWLLALRTEGAKDFQNDIKRYGVVASHGIFNNALIGLEYLFGNEEGPQGVKSHTVTAQLAFEF